MRSEPTNPHDALFRKTFANVENAAGELKAILPEALLSRLDLTTLRLVPGSYVDAGLASSQSDLLFAAELSGRPVLIYILFEHQSSVDELMPLRILKYVVRVLDQHVLDAGGGRKALPLPLVIPVVLHHSASGWTASTSVEELFDESVRAAPGVAAHVPRLSFVLDDISQLSDDALAERALGLLPTLALWALRDARRPRAVERSLGRWTATMQALLRVETGREALLTIFRYLSLVVDDLTPQTLLTTLAIAAEAKEALMTTMAERWKTEGEARGRVEGRLEGSRQLLLRQLELKFGALDATERERVLAASEQQLLLWATRILNADALGAVLAE
jgi:predicted transposase/invertase (TIGR01784 family)